MFSYRLLLILLSPVIVTYFAWQGFRQQDRLFFWQRLGQDIRHLPSNALWIHCASVGEVMTILPLLDEILNRHPEQKIIITTNTVTGARIVRQQTSDNVSHAYLPFDWSGSVQRFLKKLRPSHLLVTETEIWPNLFYYCKQYNCPVSIINARLSIKTTSARSWVKNILKLALNHVDSVYARSELDQAAYLSLGTDKKKLQITGNLKYSQTTLARTQDTREINRNYVLVASTHDDEEIQIARRWLELGREELLFIAPRHPERSQGIIRQLKTLEPVPAISVHSNGDTIDTGTDIYILDTVGELIHYFAGAKLVIMGGSFTNTGGHNILEPARYGCPILCGPHMENFHDELTLFLKHSALVQIKAYDELDQTLQHLLTDHDRLEQLKNNAKVVSKKFDHIIYDYADIIDQLLAANNQDQVHSP